MIARTTLITWIFLSPAPVRTTSKESFSSAAAAPSPPPPRARRGDRDRSGGGDAPLLLDRVLELDELEHGHLAERRRARLSASVAIVFLLLLFACRACPCLPAPGLARLPRAPARPLGLGLRQARLRSGLLLRLLGGRLLGSRRRLPRPARRPRPAPRAARCGRRSGRRGRAAARERAPSELRQRRDDRTDELAAQDVERRQRREAARPPRPMSGLPSSTPPRSVEDVRLLRGRRRAPSRRRPGSPVASMNAIAVGPSSSASSASAPACLGRTPRERVLDDRKRAPCVEQLVAQRRRSACFVRPR